jgi:hypothetical protein
MSAVPSQNDLTPDEIEAALAARKTPMGERYPGTTALEFAEALATDIRRYFALQNDPDEEIEVTAQVRQASEELGAAASSAVCYGKTLNPLNFYVRVEHDPQNERVAVVRGTYHHPEGTLETLVEVRLERHPPVTRGGQVHVTVLEGKLVQIWCFIRCRYPQSWYEHNTPFDVAERKAEVLRQRAAETRAASRRRWDLFYGGLMFFAIGVAFVLQLLEIF